MMPPAFWAFHELYHQAYFEYAYVQLVDQLSADRLVDQTFVFLAVIWQQATACESVEAFAWRLLKERVAAEMSTGSRCSSARCSAARASTSCSSASCWRDTCA
ncbi:hypothetical protein ACFY71_39830 [Streptomyces cinerochromogenes]|uniref:hypothetical protein n=1 Tax=Streptomyces cinerochromogenes TaxID=66422 RepID=UPI003677311A